MTVKELIEELKKYPGNNEVRFYSPEIDEDGPIKSVEYNKEDFIPPGPYIVLDID